MQYTEISESVLFKKSTPFHKELAAAAAGGEGRRRNGPGPGNVHLRTQITRNQKM